MANDKEERVSFDPQDFFDRLVEKLERAEAMDLRPAIKEEPLWMFSVPEDVVNGQIKSFFMMTAKQEDEQLEIQYGNSSEGDFYRVTFTGATKDDFIRCVHEIIQHVYGSFSCITQ